MNYIKQINAFWEIERERGDFTAHLQSFYFALLYFANKFAKSEFSLYREDIMDAAKVSKTHYYKVREQAKEAGLIEYEDGANARSKCIFRVLPVSHLLSQKKDTANDTTCDTANDTVCDHTHKLTKPINLLNLQTNKPQNKSTPEGGAVFSQPGEQEEVEYPPAQPAEEKEKGCGEKEKEEASIRTYYQRYKDAWWQFYQDQNNGELPPFSWRNPSLWNGIKKIQQDLSAEFEGDEERAYQEFVHILSGWQHPKNYHQHRLKPDAMHRNLVEIRRILREQPQKVKENIENVPCVREALVIYRESYLEHKELPPSIDEERDLPLLAKTLAYLKSTRPESTWEDALSGFKFICSGWPVLEMHDKFYEENFTIRYIHGNTSKIIGIFKSKQQKQSELTTASAEAWLTRNGLG